MTLSQPVPGTILCMPTLLLRAGSAEADHAPEFRYLESWVELQARRALGELWFSAWNPERPPEDPLAALGDQDRALVLANERVLVTERTLRRLAAALDAGAQAATPRNVAEVLGERNDLPPLYTLRGFERLEAQILEMDSLDGDRPRPGAGEPLTELPPVILLTRRGLEAALASPPDLSALGPVARTGLYHEFIDYYGVVRSDVLPHVPEGARRILEVGCGRGVTGELLRRQRNAAVTGVELNPVVARDAATRLDRVVVGDVEDPALAAEIAHAGPYDLVMALELFEHLATPERFLQQAAGWLAPGGTILLSTPNVGHYSVVEDLLAGRWDYLPIGLLCYTHLRFFTRKTLEDWLGRLGFHRVRLVPQVTEGSPRLEALRERLDIDAQSLRTRGFFVLVQPEWNSREAPA